MSVIPNGGVRVGEGGESTYRDVFMKGNKGVGFVLFFCFSLYVAACLGKAILAHLYTLLLLTAHCQVKDMAIR